MDYEKKYKEAFERARKLQKNSNGMILKKWLWNIFPELKESEDEKIRKSLIDMLKNDEKHYLKEIAWLEKQGEHANFRNKIKIGDKVTRNKDGVLVNLSQLKRVTKPSKQKTADNAEPKFHKGDWVVYCNDDVDLITGVEENGYCINNGGYIPFICENEMRLWNITDAKVGDVLACNKEILLFKSYSVQGRISLYCWYNGQTNNFHSKEVVDTLMTTRNKIYPATKEQRDLLFQMMKENGYEWDFEKKELKKIEEEEYNGEDFGIDSLYHAQRILEKTLGKVDGYQSDDGILEHKCAISAVKKLYEQNPIEWGEEDEKQARQIERIVHDDGCTQKLQKQIADWLKSIKERVQPKQEWSEEDEYCRHQLIVFCENCMVQDAGAKRCAHWLKSLRPQSQWKQSDEQIECLYDAIKHYQANGYPASKLNELYEQMSKIYKL